MPEKSRFGDRTDSGENMATGDSRVGRVLVLLVGHGGGHGSKVARELVSDEPWADGTMMRPARDPTGRDRG